MPLQGTYSRTPHSRPQRRGFPRWLYPVTLRAYATAVLRPGWWRYGAPGLVERSTASSATPFRDRTPGPRSPAVGAGDRCQRALPAHPHAYDPVTLPGLRRHRLARTPACAWAMRRQWEPWTARNRLPDSGPPSRRPSGSVTGRPRGGMVGSELLSPAVQGILRSERKHLPRVPSAWRLPARLHAPSQRRSCSIVPLSKPALMTAALRS